MGFQKKSYENLIEGKNYIFRFLLKGSPETSRTGRKPLGLGRWWEEGFSSCIFLSLLSLSAWRVLYKAFKRTSRHWMTERRGHRNISDLINWQICSFFISVSMPRSYLQVFVFANSFQNKPTANSTLVKIGLLQTSKPLKNSISGHSLKVPRFL